MDEIACFIMGMCTGSFTDVVLGFIFISVCKFLVPCVPFNNKQMALPNPSPDS